jgi:hypothetical protein
LQTEPAEGAGDDDDSDGIAERQIKRREDVIAHEEIAAEIRGQTHGQNGRPVAALMFEQEVNEDRVCDPDRGNPRDRL